MGRRKKRSVFDRISLPSVPNLDLEPDTKKGIFIVILLALGAIGFLGLFDMAGLAGEYLKRFLILGFGWGRWIFPAILLIWGYCLYDEDRFDIRFKNYLGLLFFILSLQALLLVFIEPAQWQAALESGRGGGYIGFILANSFIKLMGFWASLIVLLGLIIISILLMFDTTLIALFGRDSLLAKALYPVSFVFAKIFGSRETGDENEEEGEEDEESEEEENEDEEDEEEEKDEEEKEEEESDEDKEEKEEDEDDEGDLPQFKSSRVKDEDKTEDVWWKPTGIEIDLPLGLLNGKKGKPTSGDIKVNKDIIKNTLENFGIGVEMGDICVGPTVTQYTFKPAEGVKLSKITTLGNDLALALAAHPIRIEAPIPGKSLVGVEVPNQIKAVVTLKEILLTKGYQERKSNLMMALGKDVAGNGWLTNIAKMPHLLVAGATNSGKSVCLNTIIVSLLYQNNPDDLRFIMVDPKRVELPVYNDIPYLLSPVITDVPRTINALKWCLNEMDRRFDILAKAGKRNIQAYNEHAEASKGRVAKMPYIVFVIDELADLMVAAAKDIEGAIIRLAQMSRAVGIHLILATQRPSVDVITGLIKANMPARIAFSVASGTDSRTIIDTLGAEKLLGQGDMLFMNAEISKPVRLQGAFLSDNEIKKIVRYIKEVGGRANYVESIMDKQKVKGMGSFGLEGGGGSGDDDDLLEEAKEIVINMGKASASLLQRKLRVGYARAASLLDSLEAVGVIGPSNGSKPREILITKEQYASLANQGVSGVSLHRRDESKAPDRFLSDDEDDDGVPPVFRKKQEEEEESEDEEEEDDDNENNEEENEDEEENEEENDEENNGQDEKKNEEEDFGKYFSR